MQNKHNDPFGKVSKAVERSIEKNERTLKQLKLLGALLPTLSYCSGMRHTFDLPFGPGPALGDRCYEAGEKYKKLIVELESELQLDK